MDASMKIFLLISLFKNLLAKGVSVIEEAIRLTLIFGAHSAARDLPRPSSAPFDATLKKRHASFTATVLNKTTLACSLAANSG